MAGKFLSSYFKYDLVKSYISYSISIQGPGNLWSAVTEIWRLIEKISINGAISGRFNEKTFDISHLLQ
jgi:hypothetical protein